MIITRTGPAGRHDGTRARHPGINPRLDHLAADPPRRKNWPQLDKVQVTCRGGFAYAAGVLPGGETPAVPAPLRRLRPLLRLRDLLRRPRPLRRRRPAHRHSHRNPQEALDTACTVHLAGIWARTRHLTPNELTEPPTKACPPARRCPHHAEIAAGSVQHRVRPQEAFTGKANEHSHPGTRQLPPTAHQAPSRTLTAACRTRRRTHRQQRAGWSPATGTRRPATRRKLIGHRLAAVDLPTPGPPARA